MCRTFVHITNRFNYLANFAIQPITVALKNKSETSWLNGSCSKNAEKSQHRQEAMDEKTLCILHIRSKRSGHDTQPE